MSAPDDTTSNDVSGWLKSIGLGEYAEAFARNHINAATLPELNDADLRDLGVASVGHRKQFLAEIQRFGRANADQKTLSSQSEPKLTEPPQIRVEVPGAREQKAAESRTTRMPPVVPPPTALVAKVEAPGASAAEQQPEGIKASPASQASPETEQTPSTRKDDGPSRKTIWARILASKFLVGSIAAHLLFGLGATYFIVQRYAEKRKVTFAGGPPTTNASNRALEFKVSMAQKKKTGGAPPQAKRIATAGLGGLSLPEMPTTATANTIVPGMTAGMGGAGFGMGMGFGSGMGAGMGGGGGGGGGMTMFGFRGSGPGLVGTFYDLKQTRTRKPTNMAIVPKEGVNVSGPEAKRYIETVKRFVSNWSTSVLENFYRAEAQLVTPQIFIPAIAASEAPKAFGVEKECEGRRWLIHYRGEIVVPRTGRFRFVGAADDTLVVRCNMRNVLDASLPFCRVVPEANESDKIVAGDLTMCAGKWIEMRAGEALKLEVLIGECPGGGFSNFLMIEEQGAAHPPGVFPVFQLRQMSIPGGHAPPHYNAIVFGCRQSGMSSLLSGAR